LEVVDEKLQNLKNKVEDHFKFIREAPYGVILTQDLNSETFRRVMLQNSNGLYDLNDYTNKVLSSRIEKDYNILNSIILENLIKDKINLEGINSEKFIDEVLRLLEEEKIRIDNM
jgi:predicted nucleotidyltransferase